MIYISDMREINHHRLAAYTCLLDNASEAHPYDSGLSRAMLHELMEYHYDIWNWEDQSDIHKQRFHKAEAMIKTMDRSPENQFLQCTGMSITASQMAHQQRAMAQRAMAQQQLQAMAQQQMNVLAQHQLSASQPQSSPGGQLGGLLNFINTKNASIVPKK